MKTIISHDIDHITAWEHLLQDTILPKFIVRAHIELLSGKISGAEYMNRFGEFFTNKWHNIDEVIQFNQSKKIPSTFFLGVAKGLGLSYSNTKAKLWAEHILQNGCQLGLHGIAYDDKAGMEREYNLFKEITQLDSFGMRMHYARNAKNTFDYLAQVGYTFDTTEHAFKDPYKIGNMWEFPFQIMDGWVIENGKRWQTQNLDQAKENTKVIIERAFKEDLNYIGIVFHDRHFSKSFKTWMNWYTWLVEYFEQNAIPCIDFKQAIAALEEKVLSKHFVGASVPY